MSYADSMLPEALESRSMMSASVLVALGKPQYILGDVNGDGRADAISTTPVLHTTLLKRVLPRQRELALQVRLGKGDGGFGPVSQTLLLPAVQAVRVAAGDFDGDGSVDVAIIEGAASVHPGGVNILRNDGKGKLASPVLAGRFAGDLRGQVQVADFDGDGAADLGLGTHGIIAVLIGLLRPAPTQENIQLPFSRQALDVTAGDFNGDGRADIAATFGDGSVRVAYQGDRGVFKDTGPVAASGGVRVAAGDVNGDGVPDLVMMGDGSVRVARGSQEGLLPAVQTNLLPYLEQSPVMADINGDGRADLVSDQPGRLPQVLAYGKADGTFLSASGRVKP